MADTDNTALRAESISAERLWLSARADTLVGCAVGGAEGGGVNNKYVPTYVAHLMYNGNNSTSIVLYNTPTLSKYCMRPADATHLYHTCVTAKMEGKGLLGVNWADESYKNTTLSSS